MNFNQILLIVGALEICVIKNKTYYSTVDGELCYKGKN